MKSSIFNLRSNAPYILILLLLPVVLFRLGNGDYLAVGDNYLDLHPHAAFQARQWLAGEYPSWNPYICAGMPEAGYGNVSLYYPLNWIFALPPPARAFNFFMCLSYFLASLGMYLFAMTWKLKRPAALLSATAYAYGAFMLGWVHSMEAVGPAVWLGWLFFCLESLRRTRRRATPIALLTGLAWGVMAVSGHPQITIYGSLSAAAYCLYFTFTGRASRWFPAWAALSAVIGAGLAAPHLLPGLALSGESYRSALTFKRFTSPFLTTAQFLGGMFFVNAQPSLYFSAYIGIAPFALVLIALLKRRSHPLAPLGVAVIAASILLALGRATKLDSLLFHVPIYNLFSFHSRHTLEMSFFGAVLAGVGLDAVMDDGEISLLNYRLMAIVGLMAMGGVALIYASGNPVGPRLLLAPAAAAPAILLIHFSKKVKTLVAPRLLIVAAVLVMLAEPYFGNIRPMTPWNERKNAAPDSAVSAMVGKLEKGKVPSSRLLALLALHRGGNGVLHEGCQGNLGMTQGVQGALCYHPSMLRRYKAVMGVDQMGWPINTRDFLSPENRAMDIMAAKYVSYDPRYIVNWAVADRTYIDRNGFATRYGEQIELSAGPGQSPEIYMPAFTADAVGVVSAIGNVSGVRQGEAVARLTFTDERGAERVINLKAGLDTALFNHQSLSGQPEIQYTVQGIPYYGMKTWYLEAGQAATVELKPFKTKGMGLVTYLIHSDGMKQGEEAGRIVIHASDGEKRFIALRAGENTGDWAMEDPARSFGYDSPEFYRKVKPAKGMKFKGRDYPAVFILPGVLKADYAVIENGGPPGMVLVVEDATLIGGKRGQFAPLYRPEMPLHERPEYFPPGEHAPPGYHEYPTRRKLDAPIKPISLKLERLLDKGFIQISHLTLINSEKNEFYPISSLNIALGDASHFRVIYRDDIITLMENLRALPRAWLAGEARIMPFDRIIDAVQSGKFADGSNFDPLRTVLLEKRPRLPASTPSAMPAAGRGVTFEHFGANSILLHVSSDAPRWLVLSEICYPGWSARVGGRDWPMDCADGALRTLPIPPGTHRVELSFRPPLLRAGLYIEMGTLIFMALALVFFRRKTAA